MNDNGPRTLSHSEVEQLDKICDAFEQAWRAQRQPRIEDFLAQVGETLRDDLMRELIAAEVDLRRESGEQVSQQEYLDRFPDKRAVVENAFALAPKRSSAEGQSSTGNAFALAPKHSSAEGQSSTGSDNDAPRTLPETAAPLPTHIGRYRVERVLGSGQFGIVYLAHDPQLDRAVAIKVPRAERIGSGADVQRYMDEAKHAAQLDHPGIVRVHDVQQDGDIVFVVQQYVAGQSLGGCLKRDRFAPRRTAELLAAIAEAVSFAHRQGLVHRDLKPDNILLDADGSPHVADFGLALHESLQRRQRGQRAGSPAYMSPEQVQGLSHRLDGRSDIWSLGVILYEMLAGRRPFAGDSLKELYEEILQRDPRPPRQIAPAIPAELERICLKCLSKRMTDRYTTAADLAGDLRQWESATQSPAAASPQESKSAPGTEQRPAKVIPKGLRSFDAEDADFFLQLLPGPRDREGLPDSIRFWKKRFEDTDPDSTFSIGLIYGPSGCGKSSLVKAGLLPRLDSQVIPVYVEATEADTEVRLIKGLRKRVSGISPDSSLPEVFDSLRDGRSTPAGKKVLVVLDQFEQWLHAKRGEHETQLVQALRHCDGQHLQCVVMVRDDFWLAVSRFMQAIEVDPVPGKNTALVDLFDPQHAQKVLSRFGQAYGALPESEADFTASHWQFLDDSVEGLAEDGKIICVRLSLFADMVKGKPWTPGTLQDVGGAEGIGITFLEETFSASTAAPQHRLHQKAARAVLKALLPESGSEIKGGMKSRDDLLKASNYAAKPRDFDDLLRILDGELRLITPTDPEGSGFGVQGSGKPCAANEADQDSSILNPEPRTLNPLFFQLTHDYLVPSLREWLTRKQRETWRGRAELRLEERTAQWTRTHESRFLPNPIEYASIVAGVPHRKRTPNQRRVMRAATRRYGLIGSLAIFASALLGGSAWYVNGDVQARRITQAIFAAKPAELRKLIDESLPPYRRWADPRLKQSASAEDPPPEQRLKSSLALVPVDETQVGYLSRRLLDCSVDEFPVVRDYLKPHRGTVETNLWQVFRDAAQPGQARFHAGMALAAYSADAPGWTKADADFLTGQLLASNPDNQRDLRSYLEPISGQLLEQLEVRFRDATARDTVREAAANALADFATNDPARLARLASEATAEQYRIIYPRLIAAQAEQLAATQKTLLVIAREQPEAKVPESERVQLGRRRAGAAITLMRMGKRESTFDVFRVQEDPESLTQFVHRVKDRGVGAAELLDCLDRATEDRVRFGLLLALGEFSLNDIVESRRLALTEQLLEWYRSDPSSAIHGACGWLLRLPGWGLKEQVQAVDQTPLARDDRGPREWFVEKIGEDCMTFVVFPSGEFLMGSPDATEEEEEGRNSVETPHNVRLTRSFAMQDREVTRGQFGRFIQATKAKFVNIDEYSPGDEYPVVGEMWYEAVLFCRWLTEQAGMTEVDQCYENPEKLPKGPDGFPENWPFYPERGGFRLPTEAEWEYACRAGMRTAYGFGSDRSELRHYGWFMDNEGKKTHVGGELRPNLRGLVDMHGNAVEWCHDWFGDYKTLGATDPSGPKEKDLSRVLRGGGWFINSRNCRSAYRGGYQPANRDAVNGFRVVWRAVGQNSKRNP